MKEQIDKNSANIAKIYSTIQSLENTAKENSKVLSEHSIADDKWQLSMQKSFDRHLEIYSNNGKEFARLATNVEHLVNDTKIYHDELTASKTDVLALQKTQAEIMVHFSQILQEVNDWRLTEKKRQERRDQKTKTLQEMQTDLVWLKRFFWVIATTTIGIIIKLFVE